jgi:hypothetical protein
MPWYIKSPELGLFVGSFLGLGFFEFHVEDGQCSPDEEPVRFATREEAQKFLDSWVGGPAGCYVVDVDGR